MDVQCILNDYPLTFREHDVTYELFPTGHNLDSSTSILVLRLHDPDVFRELSGGQSTVGVVVFFESEEVLSDL